jgi:hypothetical protein
MLEQPEWSSHKPKTGSRDILPDQLNFSVDSVDQPDEIEQRDNVPVWLKDRYGPAHYHPKNPETNG